MWCVNIAMANLSMRKKLIRKKCRIRLNQLMIIIIGGEDTRVTLSIAKNILMANHQRLKMNKIYTVGGYVAVIVVIGIMIYLIINGI